MSNRSMPEFTLDSIREAMAKLKEIGPAPPKQDVVMTHYARTLLADHMRQKWPESDSVIPGIFYSQMYGMRLYAVATDILKDDQYIMGPPEVISVLVDELEKAAGGDALARERAEALLRKCVVSEL